MKLIREMDQATRELDEVQTAIKEMGGDPFAKAKASSYAGMFEPEADLERIVNHHRVESAHMSDDDLREAIGRDFEMLEYSVEEAEPMIAHAMKLLGRG